MIFFPESYHHALKHFQHIAQSIHKALRITIFTDFQYFSIYSETVIDKGLNLAASKYLMGTNIFWNDGLNPFLGPIRYIYRPMAFNLLFRFLLSLSYTILQLGITLQLNVIRYHVNVKTEVRLKIILIKYFKLNRIILQSRTQKPYDLRIQHPLQIPKMRLHILKISPIQVSFPGIFLCDLLPTRRYFDQTRCTY